MSVFLILVVFMGGVSAADDNDMQLLSQSIDEVITAENTDEILTVEVSSAGNSSGHGLKSEDLFVNKEILRTDNNENSVLGNTITVEGSTFNAIQNAINSAKAGDTIYLSGTYTGSGTQININKHLTIIGSDGCTLDAQGKSDIFSFGTYLDGTFNTVSTYCKSNIYNINFYNGKNAINIRDYGYTTYGKVVTRNYVISGCNFSNMSNAIFFNENERWNNLKENLILNVYNSTFNNTNNAIHLIPYSWAGFQTTKLNVSDCNFTNNKASAIYIVDMNTGQTDGNGYSIEDATYNSTYTIAGCNFMNNNASDGGAIYYSANSGNLYQGQYNFCNFTIINCNFINNTASYGGAIYYSVMESPLYAQGNYQVHWLNSTISGCNFTSNKAKSGGAIYQIGNGILSPSIKDSSFINNKANFKQLTLSVNNNYVLTPILEGNEDYINAIISSKAVTFSNVTYWNGEVVNSDIVSPKMSSRVQGINITIEVYNSNNDLVDNVTFMTNSTGQVVYDYSKLNYEKYTFKVYHLDDTYYTSSYIKTITLDGPKKYSIIVLDNKTHYSSNSASIYAVMEDEKNNSIYLDNYFLLTDYRYSSIIFDNYLWFEYSWDEWIYEEYGYDQTMLVVRLDKSQYQFDNYGEYGYGELYGISEGSHNLEMTIYQYGEMGDYSTGEIIYSDSFTLTVGKLLFIYLHES